MKPVLLVMPGNENFAQSLGRHIEFDISTVHWRHFPDGESLIRLDVDCDGREVAFLAAQHDPDRIALPMRFAAATARELGAKRVGLISPYLGYMRQDKRFHPGESINAIHYARFISETVDWLVTVDPHLHRLNSLDAVYSIPNRAVSAMDALAQWISEQVTAPILIGPDSESTQWVEQVANLIGAPWMVLRKTRLGDRQVQVSLPDRSVIEGRQPVLIDDIASSGRTLIETVGQLRKLGVAAPICAVVHGLFADHSDQLLLNAGAARVVSCNTVPHPSNAIDVSAAVANGLAELRVATLLESEDES